MADRNSANKGSKWFGPVLDFFAPKEGEQSERKLDQSATIAQQPQTPAPQVSTPTASGNIAQGKAGVSNPDIRAQLQQAIANSNVNGLDFFEFNKALDTDKSIREQDKYQKVYAFMLSMSQDGLDLKKTLIDSGKFYLTILDGEKTGMEEEFKHLEAERVGSKRAEIEQTTGDIEALEKQKAQIEQQLHEKRTKAAELQDQVDSESIALQRQRSDFNATFDELYSEYQDKLANIDKYITEQPVSKQEANQ